jgi:hypothetical protein
MHLIIRGQRIKRVGAGVGIRVGISVGISVVTGREGSCRGGGMVSVFMCEFSRSGSIWGGLVRKLWEARAEGFCPWATTHAAAVDEVTTRMFATLLVRVAG